MDSGTKSNLDLMAHLARLMFAHKATHLVKVITMLHIPIYDLG